MIVKIWPIKASYGGEKGKVGGKNGVRNAINYVMDAQKVCVDSENLGDVLPAQQSDFCRVFRYAADENKTEGKYISTYRCANSLDPARDFDVSNQQLAIESSGKAHINRGHLAYHMVQSFPEDLELSNEEVHQCGCELLQRLGIYQGVVCTHVHPVVDEEQEVHGKCKHNHILFNAFRAAETYQRGMDGPYKYHDTPETYELLQIYNDEIAIEHGLPIIRESGLEGRQSWTEREAAKKGTSWKAKVRQDIDEVRRRAKDWDDFRHLMEEKRYSVRARTVVTYTTPEGRKVRGETLGKAYTQERLNLYWAERDHVQQEVQREFHMDRMSGIIPFAEHYQGELSVKIPLGRRDVEDPAFCYLPLRTAKGDQETLLSYMDEKKRYDICDEAGHPVNAATGMEVVRCMEALRNQEQIARFAQREKVREEQEKERIQREEEQRRAEKEEQARIRRRVAEYNKRNPYYIDAYDENGHPRSALELLFILLLVALDKEYLLWDNGEVKPGETPIEVIQVTRDRGVQKAFDAMAIAREEDLGALSQVERRLAAAEDDYYCAKRTLERITRAKERMEPLAKAVAAYQKTKKIAESIRNLPEGEEKRAYQEKYADEIERYKAAAHTLYAYRTSDEAGVRDFDRRYDKIKRDLQMTKERMEKSDELRRRLQTVTEAWREAEYRVFQEPELAPKKTRDIDSILKEAQEKSADGSRKKTSKSKPTERER